LGLGGGLVAAIITFCRAASLARASRGGQGSFGWLRTKGAGHPRAVGGRRAGQTAVIRRCRPSRRCRPRHLRAALLLPMIPTIVDLSGPQTVQRGLSAVPAAIQARRPLNVISLLFLHALRPRHTADRNRTELAVGRLPGRQAAGPVGLPRPNRSNWTDQHRCGVTETVTPPKALCPRATGTHGPLHPTSPRAPARDPIKIGSPTTRRTPARQAMCIIRRRDRPDMHRRR
jgi:hypothetical protein